MNKYILKIVIFVAIPIPILFFLAYATDEGLKNSRVEYVAEWNDIFQSKINADILVLGSSRAWAHVSPQILDSTFHCNSYNLGLRSSHFLMQYCRFKTLIAHNPIPKKVILCLDIFTFEREKQLYGYEYFLPYVHDSLLIKYSKGYEGELGEVEKNFPLYKYNGKVNLMLKGLISYFHLHHFQQKNYKGYEGQAKKWDGTFDFFVKNNPKKLTQQIDNETVTAFEDFLNYCNKNNIELVLVYTPEYFEAQHYFENRTAILQTYTQLSVKYGHLFLDYSNDEICKKKELFYNSQHLNKEGAEIFSRLLVSDLKEKSRSKFYFGN